jgi:hypothetical protein
MARVEPIKLSQSQRAIIAQLSERTQAQRTGRGGSAIVFAVTLDVLRGYNKNVIQALKTKGVLRPFRDGYRLILDSIEPEQA